MVTDSTGREIKVGDVITHASRRANTVVLDLGVVRRIHPTEQSLIWQGTRQNDFIWSTPDTPAHWGNRWCKESQILFPDRCTVTGMTEDELKERLGL